MLGVDTIEAIPEGEPKRGSRGRKVVSEEERERLLEAYDSSGLTQRAFCRRKSINYHTFVAWLGRRRSLGSSAAQDERFVETLLTLGHAPAQGAFELDLGAGMVVRVTDEEALVRLIRRLRS